MKMPFEYTDVIDGHMRLRCHTTEEVTAWTQYILAAGRIPKFEPGPRLIGLA
jgi:hypothetical protein